MASPKQIAVAAGGAAVALGLGLALHNILLLTLGGLCLGVALALGSAPAKSWRGWWVLAFLTLLVASTLYGQLDGLLKGMHVFGTPSFGLSSLGARSGQPGAAATVVQSWFNWYGQPEVSGLFASPRHVAYLTLAVDTFLLVPAYATVLFLLISRGRKQLKQAQEKDEAARSHGEPGERKAEPDDHRLMLRDGYVTVASGARVAVVVAVVADIIENTGYFAAVRYYWGSGTAPTWARLLVHATGYFTLVKMIALLLAVLALILIGLGLRGEDEYRRQATQLGTAVKIVRGQIAILVLLVVALVIQPQAPDTIRRWNVRQGGVAIFLTVVVAFINWAFARRLMQKFSSSGQRARLLPGVIASIGGGLAAVTVIAWRAGAPTWGLAIPAGFWLFMWLLGLLVKDPKPGKQTLPTFGQDVIARVVGVAVLVLFGLAVLRASVGPVVLAKGGSELGLLVGFGLGLVFGAWLLYLFLRWDRISFDKERVVAPIHGPFLRVMAAALFIGGFLWWRLASNVWAVSDFLGTVGVLLLFLAMAAVVVGGLTMLAEWVEPPGAFRLLGFTRIPVFVLLLGWFVLSSFLPVGSGFHDVRFLTVPASATGVPPSLKGELTRPAQLLRRWLRDLPPEAFQPGAGGARRGVPVIFVATAGGGVRAAYWTSLVLDCLFQPHPVTGACPGAPGGRDATSSIIVGSGISGGSLGLVDYVTHDVQVTEGRSDGPNWVRTRLGGDYLAPSLAWQLAVELPRAFFRFDTGMDRAEAIERALQQSWVDGPWTPGWEHFLWQGSDAQDDGPLTQGFLDLWRRQATGPGETRAAVPLLVLNGTSVTDGCRVNTSALDANGNHFGQPGGDRVARQIGCLSTRIFDQRTGEPLAEVLAATRDFDDYLCVVNGQQRVDVRLSTAALLSARFPFVSPAGRITDCGSTGQATYVVDGGYLDSSGAATAVELWQALEPFIASYNAGSSLVGGDPSTTCLVPYLIQIDNGYQEPSPAPPTKRPGELTVPLRTLFKARSAFTALARQDGAVLFNHPIAADGIQVADRYAHFFPRGHPGVEAPLGWVLSNGATNDLEAQIAENQQEIADVRAWLSDPLPCGS